MNLESNQQMHDLALELFSKVSPSNDGKQMQMDAVNTLVRGAELISNGRNMGLNDDQTLDLANYALIQQERNAYGMQKQSVNPHEYNQRVTTNAIEKELFRRANAKK